MVNTGTIYSVTKAGNMESFYILHEGEKKGPYTLRQLKALDLDATTIVWHPLISSWTTAENIEALEIPPAHKDEIKVIIADDHVLYRSGVRVALASKKNIRVLAEAEHGQHLLQLLKSQQPDVILLDIQMPVMDGIETLPKIKQLYPHIKVIMLTMVDDQSMISKLMQSGANSYLTKTSDAELIYQTIKTCHEQTYCFNTFTKRAVNAPERPGARSYSPPDGNTYANGQARSFEYRLRVNNNPSLYAGRSENNNAVRTSPGTLSSRSALPGAGKNLSRDKLLETFKDAIEIAPEKRPLITSRVIFDSALICGVLMALYFILQSM